MQRLASRGDPVQPLAARRAGLAGRDAALAEDVRACQLHGVVEERHAHRAGELLQVGGGRVPREDVLDLEPAHLSGPGGPGRRWPRAPAGARRPALPGAQDGDLEPKWLRTESTILSLRIPRFADLA